MLVLHKEITMRGTIGSEFLRWPLLRGEGYILIRIKDIICIYYLQRTVACYLQALRPEASADFTFIYLA